MTSMNFIKRHNNCVAILSVCFHAVILLVQNAQARQKLGFASSNLSFKIAIFADLHYGENAWTDWGPLQDQKSNRVMSKVLDGENPGMQPSTGRRPFHPLGVGTYLGLLCLETMMIWHLNGPMNGLEAWECQAFNVQMVPWQQELSKWLNAISSGQPVLTYWRWTCNKVCLTPHMDQEDFGLVYQTMLLRLLLISILNHQQRPRRLSPSVSNYVIKIASYKHPKSPAALLYFLDSGGGSYPEVISKRQAKWFQQRAAQINPSSRIPEIVFWHIPSQAYKKIAPHAGRPVKHPCVGSINLEPVASQTAEWGIMDILTNRTSVKAVFVGHNHGLDWCCPCESLWLCFARHTGYGGYGNWPRGARILDLFEEPSALKSWIRMEDGTTHSHITINTASKDYIHSK